MDINEMHLAVQQGVDKINSFQADSLLSEEIDLEVNKAINKFIQLKYGKNNIYGKGFEESQKRIDDLRTLLVDKPLKCKYIADSINSTFMYKSEVFPEGYRHLIKIVGEVAHRSDCRILPLDHQQQLADIPEDIKVSKQVMMKFSQQDDVFNSLVDPFNTTKLDKPIFSVEGDNIIIYTNDIFIIEKVKLTYIKNPSVVSLSLGNSCELPIHTHQEIVDMAIGSILEVIGDPRYQTHQSELGKNE